MVSTCPIFKRRKIVNFVTSMSGHDQRQHKSLKTHSNDTTSNMNCLLDFIYMGVRLGGVFSLLLEPALLVSAILCYLCVHLFDVPLLLLLPLSALALQGFKGVPSLPPAALPLPLSNSSPPLLSLPPSSTLPFRYPSPPACWRLPHRLSPDALLTS